jgi:hypothetical protein
MPSVHLPAPGRPYVLIEPAGERQVLDLEPETVIALYKAHGALLMRGFGADVSQFGQLCAPILYDFGRE